uniref:Uncharacterized protein n=1 Tax=Panagrolaimus superbus TaxID=310955 RepID=A0A914YDI1_9BILA
MKNHLFDFKRNSLSPSAVCKQLADIYDAPVIHFRELEIYEVNLPYNEFVKKCGTENVKQKLTEAGLFQHGNATIQITGTGYWDHLNWFNIRGSNNAYALPLNVFK